MAWIINSTWRLISSKRLKFYSGEKLLLNWNYRQRKIDLQQQWLEKNQRHFLDIPTIFATIVKRA
jgi:hypothetical protein